MSTFKVDWFGEKAIRATTEGAIDALIRGSEFLLTKANETIPFEEGILKDSGDVDVDGAKLAATVFYNTPYAARQHEEVSWKHMSGRRPKWLQMTFQEQHSAVKDIMADALRKKL